MAARKGLVSGMPGWKCAAGYGYVGGRTVRSITYIQRTLLQTSAAFSPSCHPEVMSGGCAAPLEQRSFPKGYLLAYRAVLLFPGAKLLVRYIGKVAGGLGGTALAARSQPVQC